MTPDTPGPDRRSANRLASFLHAFAGWGAFVRGTPNARIHLAIGLAAILVGFFVGLGPVEWAILWLVIGLVFVAESFNSALEAVVDLASPELHPLAKKAKDVAAGGVLFAACVAVIVGLLLLGPPLVARLELILSPLLP